MNASDNTQRRVSYMELGLIYFYTATIKSWLHLMKPDCVKTIVTDCLHNLWSRKLMEIYGFVVMPNHIHFIWKALQMNGRERPQGSFMKFTAHHFKRYLRAEEPQQLVKYKVTRSNKEYEFWQRDPYAFELNRMKTAWQKLTYIHNNPLQEHWQLVKRPEEYYFSSARFYETGIDDFGFLRDIRFVMG